MAGLVGAQPPWGLAHICRPEGWDVRCQIGSDVARSVGGSGELAKAQTSTGQLDLRLAFGLDEGYSPPQGPVRLLRTSRYLRDKRPSCW